MKALITLCLVGLMFSACKHEPVTIIEPNNGNIKIRSYGDQTDTSTLRLNLLIRMTSVAIDASNADTRIEIYKSSYENYFNESDRVKANKWIRKKNSLLDLYKKQEDTLYRIYKYKPKP